MVFQVRTLTQVVVHDDRRTGVELRVDGLDCLLSVIGEPLLGGRNAVHIRLFAVPDQRPLAHPLEDERGEAIRLLVILENLDPGTLILDLLLLAFIARPDSRVQQCLADADDPIGSLARGCQGL